MGIDAVGLRTQASPGWSNRTALMGARRRDVPLGASVVTWNTRHLWASNHC